MPRTRPVVPPIHHSVTYFLDDRAYQDVQAGGLIEHWYGRFRNPTVDSAASEIADLEGAAAGFMTSSGMGAIATTLLTLLRAGDRLVAARQVYGDTRDLLVRDLPAWGVDVRWVDAVDLDAWRREIDGGPTRVVYAETLSNPQLELTDLPALAELAHGAGARLVIDNTFATPYVVQPLRFGADVVVHSATKFLNGHSDAIAGAVAADADLVTDVQRRVITIGTSLGPYEAYLVWRGLQTFEVRMGRQTETARALATALDSRPDVTAVTTSIAARVPGRGGCCAGDAPELWWWLHGDDYRRGRRRTSTRCRPQPADRLRGNQPRRRRDSGQHAGQFLALLADAARSGAPPASTTE